MTPTPPRDEVTRATDIVQQYLVCVDGDDRLSLEDKQLVVDIDAAIQQAVAAQRKEFEELERWAYAVCAHTEDGDWQMVQQAICGMHAWLEKREQSKAAAIRSAGGQP